MNDGDQTSALPVNQIDDVPEHFGISATTPPMRSAQLPISPDWSAWDSSGRRCGAGRGCGASSLWLGC